MRVIPAIDIIEGKCVRLTQGDYDTKKVYNENPLEVAKMFEGAGIQYVHIVDLDGAKEGRIINYKVLEQIANRTSLKIDFGGGLKSNEDLHIAFNSGAKQVTGGSIAIKDPGLFNGWIQKYGSQKIILGADTKEGAIAISGWREKSDKKILPFIKEYHSKGIRYIICTDITKDGMLAGPSVDLYKSILEEFKDCSEDKNIKLIASGGVTSIDDINRLEDIGCEAVIIGKALYENKISLRDLAI